MMRKVRRSFIAAAAAAGLTLAGIALVAPSASAANGAPGNCPADSFCVWDAWGYPAPTTTPTLVTEDDWAGAAAGRHFFNGTPGAVDMTYVQTLSDGSLRTHEHCVTPGTGSYFTIPVNVTEVVLNEAGC
jgi:hypothetical protein